MTDYGYARMSVGRADTLANQRLVLRDGRQLNKRDNWQ